MMLFIKRSMIFLLTALILAFVILPAFEHFVGGVDLEILSKQIENNLTFASLEMWKRTFIYFLGLWCGKAILWAISVGTVNTR